MAIEPKNRVAIAFSRDLPFNRNSVEEDELPFAPSQADLDEQKTSRFRFNNCYDIFNQY